MRHASKKRNHSGTKIGLVIALLLVVASVCYFFLKPIEKQKEETKELIGEIIDVQTSQVTIRHDNARQYLFSKEMLKVDSKKCLVGNTISIQYTGTLIENSLEIQTITIKKATIHEVVKNDNLETGHDEALATLLKEMTVEQKVAQMFMVRVPESKPVALIRDYQFGGYILFAEDFKGKSKLTVQKNIASYQEVAKIPLLIGTDEEGGTINRVSKYFRTTPFASPQQIFKNGGYDAIVANTTEKAEFLQTFGINVNFAPVADVSTNPSDFIYERSFGQEAKETAKYVTTVVDAMKQADQGIVLKHFPGYGNNGDTHKEMIHDTRPIETFKKSDLLPFQAGIEQGAHCVLVSHTIVECMDEKNPASLSLNVHQVLREDLDFKGVIITDDLAMNGATEYGTSEEVAIKAVQAGNDMLLSSDAIIQSKAVIQAVKDGKIPENQIDKSVLRILTWKKDLGILK